MKPTASPIEREQIVATVAGPAIDAIAGSSRPLVVNDRTGRLTPAHASLWNRHAAKGRSGSLWPEQGPFDAALIRLLHDKSAMKMALAAVASNLEQDAPLYVVGANDEGAKSIGRFLVEHFDEVETLDTRKRCRIIRAYRNQSPVEKPDLNDWMQSQEFSALEQSQSWFSWPGLFAKGLLDPGSALLISALKTQLAKKSLKFNKPILDFGCGIGILSSAILSMAPDASVTALDIDAFAVHAAKLNVPKLDVRNSDSWSAISGSERFGLIISNPPIHTGKSGDFRVLDDLLAGARNRLLFKGALVLVVQRQIPIQKKLQLHFKHIEMLAQNSRYWIWKAS